MACYRIQGVPASARWIKCNIGKLVLRGTRIVFPKQLRCQFCWSWCMKVILEVWQWSNHAHQSVMAGHWQRGREGVCKTCHGCQLVSQLLKAEPMVRTELLSAPWKHLVADLLGPLPAGDYVFVVVAYWSVSQPKTGGGPRQTKHGRGPCAQLYFLINP